VTARKLTKAVLLLSCTGNSQFVQLMCAWKLQQKPNSQKMSTIFSQKKMTQIQIC